jgi:hypothetical protein
MGSSSHNMEDLNPIDESEKDAGAGPRRFTWLKRLGFAGFIFFLIKGLAWLAIFAGVGKCVME